MHDLYDDVETGIVAVSEPENDPYTADKLLGVALLGAVTGLFGYFVYHQLDVETRSNLKATAVGAVKSQVAGFFHEEE